MWWKIATSAAAGLAVAALAIGHLALSQVSGLHAQVSQERATLSIYAGRLAADEALIGQIQGKLGSLTTPQDPLSAYDDICNTQAVSSTTGLTQTYWYPCTDSAETIPQPGN